MDIKFIDFDKMGDYNGSLIALEENKNIPFQIKRVYYIFDTKKNVRRGYHAHKNLEQVLIAVKGSCKIHLDNTYESNEVILDDPSKGLYIESLVWREMYDFSNDCVLLVLASDYYTKSDYIRDYGEFIQVVSNLKFVNYNETFLNLSTKWLSDSEIKKLTMAPEINKTKQLEWFSSLENRKDYYISGILYNDKPIGAFGLRHITSDSAEYWAFIGEKEYWSGGIGKQMLNYIVKYAKKLGLSYIYGKVHKENYRSISYCENYGFTKLNEENDVIYLIRKL
jgi:RimJ/RimL family protein N-acetyltransferase